MRSRVTTSITAILAILAMAGAAQADEFEIAGRHLTIQTMAGYCAVGHSDPADRLLYGIADEAGRGMLRTLSFQADCVALDKLHKDRSFQTDVEPSLLFQFNLMNGEESAIPMTRDKFLEIMATVLTSQYSDEIYALAKEGSEAAIARIKEKMGAAMADTTLTETKILGVLDRDDLGVYIGIIQTYDNAGKPYAVAGVGATTLVNGLPLTITRTDRYVSAEQFPALTAEVKRVLGALVARNEDPI
jgi:hypothetical protein